MIDAITLAQVKAFARQDGLILSVVWMASMWLLMQRPDSSWGALLMLCTPFFLAWRMKTFRDKVLGGAISFRRALCFACYVCLYASIIFALAQFLYFRYLDHGRFLTIVRQALDVLRPYYNQNNISFEDMELGCETLALMSPMHLTLTFMMQNLMVGAVLSVIIALIYKKSKT